MKSALKVLVSNTWATKNPSDKSNKKTIPTTGQTDKERETKGDNKIVLKKKSQLETKEDNLNKIQEETKKDKTTKDRTSDKIKAEETREKRIEDKTT